MFDSANISVTDVFMARPQPPHELLPLTPPVFHILLALSDEDRHGYGIMQDVARQTDGALQLGPGTLYGCLKRMLAAGLVEESGERPDPALDDERRRYSVLLYAYPPEFRRQYGGPMEQLLRDRCRDLARRPGGLTRLRFAGQMMADWLRTTVRERAAVWFAGRKPAR